MYIAYIAYVQEQQVILVVRGATFSTRPYAIYSIYVIELKIVWAGHRRFSRSAL